MTDLDKTPYELSKDASLKTLLEKRIAVFMSPLETFIHRHTTAGILLVVFSLSALLIANTSYSNLIKKLSDTEMGIFSELINFRSALEISSARACWLCFCF